mmetsp:Transcript_23646/g.20102  ORF Transcript_23646/g.20102 Transcript_23646/m.20102 type:complete len:122 (+) Transcript_23646:308-673(+)
MSNAAMSFTPVFKEQPQQQLVSGLTIEITMCIWFLCVLPRIVREFMDGVIEQIKEEAKRRHEDPPEIDEEAIIKVVVSLITTLNIALMLLIASRDLRAHEDRRGRRVLWPLRDQKGRCWLV